MRCGVHFTPAHVMDQEGSPLPTHKAVMAMCDVMLTLTYCRGKGTAHLPWGRGDSERGRCPTSSLPSDQRTT